jgi:voltage-gated sodium channel type II alpha
VSHFYFILQEGLTDDDYDMYYEIWQQFDPNGTQYIRYSQLSDFLDVLEAPLQIHKPNKFKIVSMDIPICKGDLCYCVDVLDALTKDFFARKGNPVEETAELGEVTAQADRPGYEPISSTLWRQREEYCARMIQSAWRRQARMAAALLSAGGRRINGISTSGGSGGGSMAARCRPSTSGRDNIIEIIGGGGGSGPVGAQALVVLQSER